MHVFKNGNDSCVSHHVKCMEELVVATGHCIETRPVYYDDKISLVLYKGPSWKPPSYANSLLFSQRLYMCFLFYAIKATPKFD